MSGRSGSSFLITGEGGGESSSDDSGGVEGIIGRLSNSSGGDCNV